MNGGRTFVMAGGGTGGHVIPSVAVARELRRRGHDVLFIGTRAGFEGRLVPDAGFQIEWIEIGGLQRVGIRQKVKSLLQLPFSILRSRRLLRSVRAAAVFSMGGYVAGPVMLAARVTGTPIVLMEPNAVPGLTARKAGRFVARALVSFPEAVSYFPPGKAEITGLPVRPEFFAIEPRRQDGRTTILITGGSRGSRTLNNAARESWPLFAAARTPVRIVHQTGIEAHEDIARDFRTAGVEGEIVPFISDMPRAYAEADLIVSRSGAGTVSEIAAAGRAAILCPFPFAADDHQTRNAESLVRIGAAQLVPDKEMNGRKLFDEVSRLAGSGELERMSSAARRFAKPDAAARAANLLEELAATEPRP